MKRSFALYTTEPDGISRAGVVHLTTDGNSMREASAALRRRMPNLPAAGVFLARRSRLFGAWCDGERLPVDPPEGVA